MAIRVAINGFGRIGRAFFKLAKDNKDINIVAINDLADPLNLAYLLKYDSVYGKSGFEVEADSERGLLNVDGKEIQFLSQRDPNLLPWGDLEIDIVVEATGVFASYEKSKVHLDTGAKRVVISAPVKDSPTGDIKGETILMGVNDEKLENCDISSNASCTTNAGSPLISILNETLGIEKAILNTVHGYTASQKIVDSPDAKDFRRGRAGASNIIPSTTGAAIATTKAIKELEGKFDGVAVRIPVISGSLVDITFISKKETTVEEVNNILKEAEKDKRWQGIFRTSEEPLVSTDILGETHTSIADLGFTKVVDGNLVKVLSWYDNEMGYAHALLLHVIKSGNSIKK